MISAREQFWQGQTFAFVGNSAKKGFPRLSYGKSKKLGKTAFAVDPSCDAIDGDRAYPDFDALPHKVEAAVLEVPREETAEWVKKAADAGIQRVWIHMNRDTPEALEIAKDRLAAHWRLCRHVREPRAVVSLDPQAHRQADEAVLSQHSAQCLEDPASTTVAPPSVTFNIVPLSERGSRIR